MRTVWNRDEKNEVFEGMIAVAVDRPRLSNKELMRQGQLILPVDRRVIVNDQRTFNYKAMIQAARDAAEKIRSAKIPEPEPVAEVPAVNDTPPEPAKRIDTIGDLFELLVDAITDRVMEKIEAKLEQKQPPVVKIESPQTGWLDELENLVVRRKKPVSLGSCLVVGLNGAQVDAVRQHQPNVNFTFVTAEHALSHTTLHKDHTILMTKFINHGVHGKYKKHQNLHYCNGGVSELKTLLNGLFGRP